MADYIAHPEGGMREKGQEAEQPKVQDVVAPEAKPEESTPGKPNSDVTPTTMGEKAEASETAKPEGEGEKEDGAVGEKTADAPDEAEKSA